MYQKILVPLDGSKLAECALSHVINLVKDGAVGDETKKQMVRDRISNPGQTFPSPYPAPSTGYHQESKKSDAGKEEAMDSLTATYWG